MATEEDTNCILKEYDIYLKEEARLSKLLTEGQDKLFRLAADEDQYVTDEHLLTKNSKLLHRYDEQYEILTRNFRQDLMARYPFNVARYDVFSTYKKIVFEFNGFDSEGKFLSRVHPIALDTYENDYNITSFQRATSQGITITHGSGVPEVLLERDLESVEFWKGLPHPALVAQQAKMILMRRTLLLELPHLLYWLKDLVDSYCSFDIFDLVEAIYQEKEKEKTKIECLSNAGATF